MSNTLIVIIGPTASGKSELGLKLAPHLPLAVINADSQQLFQDLSTLTACPSASEQLTCPHYLYQVLPPYTDPQVQRWRDQVTTLLPQIHQQNRVPVLIGGSGFYIKSLLYGLHELPPIDDAVEAQITHTIQTQGTPALHQELQRLDPAMAAKLHPHDTYRLTRALGIALSSGKPMSAWLASQPTPPLATQLNVITVALLPPRELLYQRINQRFVAMVDRGLAELQELSAKFPESIPIEQMPIMKVLGAQPLWRHLQGLLSLDEAIRLSQQHSRNYAKRQFTWIRNQVKADIIIDNCEHGYNYQKILHLCSTIKR